MTQRQLHELKKALIAANISPIQEKEIFLYLKYNKNKGGRPTGRKKICWAGIDWSMKNCDIAKMLDISPQAVAQKRKQTV